MSDPGQLYRLFDEAVSRSPDERAAFVAEATGGNPELRRALEALLERDAREGTVLDLPFEVVVDALITNDADEPAGPSRVGPYRIVREIGRGGMGTVYLAEREDGEFDRQVAVKVVRRGMDTDDILHRFRSERQILARLEHPNIGRLYDGGATADGRPYFAMEFVEGRPITEHAPTFGPPCARADPPLSARRRGRGLRAPTTRGPP